MTHSRRAVVKSTAAGLLTAALPRPRPTDAAGRSGDGDQSDRIRIGQIGTRHAHASGKMATLRKYSELFEVVGIVEPDADQRARVEEMASYRGLRWLTIDELLSTPGLQAVLVETAVDRLVPTAARCVATGLHVHLDKPAGDSWSGFRRVLEAATAQGRVIQMGYMFRNNPAFRFLFHAVRSGWLGDVFEVHAVMSKTVDDAARAQLARYRGGAMFELGCHLVDALVIVLGEPDRVTPFLRQTGQEPFALRDNCLAVFEYPRATATVRSALVEVDGFRRRQFVVCGDRGSIQIMPLEPPRLTLTLDRPQGPYRQGSQQVELPKAAGRYDDDLLDLARIIRGEKSADYSAEHDLIVHRAILQASDMPLA